MKPLVDPQDTELSSEFLKRFEENRILTATSATKFGFEKDWTYKQYMNLSYEDWITS